MVFINMLSLIYYNSGYFRNKNQKDLPGNADQEISA